LPRFWLVAVLFLVFIIPIFVVVLVFEIILVVGVVVIDAQRFCKDMWERVPFDHDPGSEAGLAFSRFGGG
jgi:hypothetical protein